MPGLRQQQDLKTRKLIAGRIEVKFGVRRRSYALPLTAGAISSTGTLADTYVTFPKKAWIEGIGIRSAVGDVTLATSDGFQIETRNGTVLATFFSGSDYVLGTGAATMRANSPDGTFVATNKPLVFRVHATNPGVSGSVYYFVDYQPSDHDGGRV